MKYNTKRTNIWKVVLSTFKAVILIVLITKLGEQIGTGSAIILIVSIYWFGASYGWFMYKFNWKARRQIKREAVEEVCNYLEIPKSVDDLMKEIKRP